MSLDLERMRLPGIAPGARVVAAMSGGVDSSVVAAAMKRLGYDVIGITLQLYDHGSAIRRKGACCAGQDIHDARRVAERLDIPHYVLDYEERFRAEVMEQFARSYLAGETPIPCILCNERIKFADLLELAGELGADCLVTGHYVRWVDGLRGPELHRAADPDRDQSYFLFRTTRDQLPRVRFPLGSLKKGETRALARRLGLATADKPDSQDICFVPQGRYTDVIARLSAAAGAPGDIVDLERRIVGRHDGIENFTVGQRRGLGLATRDAVYVVRVDAARHEVVVGPRSALATRRILLREVSWLGDSDWPARARPLFVKVRSTRPPLPGTLMEEENQPWIVLEGSEEGVAPGQACVFYESGEAGSRLLGGAWIAGNR